MTNEMKPIRNWPDYYVTRFGEVYSTRNSRTGEPKKRATRADGAILLMVPGKRQWIKVEKLVQEAFGEGE